MTPTSYDDIPYESDPFPAAQPDRLAVIARLFGMEPAPVAECRVLEIGSAAGNNLIPHALLHPKSVFVGIDPGVRSIGEATSLVATLGLENITFLPLRFQDVTVETHGSFDYIIAHGVFSWISPDEQEELLGSLRTLLAPQGVAYVSYNAYPGWHLRDAIRQMLLLHVRGEQTTSGRIARARALLDLLQQSYAAKKAPAFRALAEQVTLIRDFPDWYLFHDMLEGENHPVLLSELVARARARGLEYLGDAELKKMTPYDLKDQERRTLGTWTGELVEIEQYLDFLRNEYFRRTLLCNREVTLSRGRWYERLPELALGFQLRPEVQPVPLANESVQFIGEGRPAIVTDEPLLKSALSLLSERWPEVMPFETVLEEAAARLRAAAILVPDDARNRLLEAVFRGATAGQLSLHSVIPPCSAEIPARPQVSALVREQVARGRQVTTLHHAPVVLDETGRELARLLDGSRTVGELAAELGQTEDEVRIAVGAFCAEGSIMRT